MNASSQTGRRESHLTDSAAVSIERFEQILEAYGAAAERWPDDERGGAERLVRESSRARGLLEEATLLDDALDLLPAETSSAELRTSVMARAPRRSLRRWQRSVVAAIPVAAAAGLAVWLSGATRATRHAVSPQAIQVGEYSSPTDVLLGSIGVDVTDSVPKIGCSDSDLGCASPASDPLERSERSHLQRTFA